MRTKSDRLKIKQTSETDFLEMPRWKRAVDIMCSLAAMPLLALLTLLTATVMAVASPGPVLYRQERVGYRGRRFMGYKFRTMHVGSSGRIAEARANGLIRSSAPPMKTNARGDARLIPGGWLMRAARLDDLPQIINVLRGEMSLVGPRPCAPTEYGRYLPEQKGRFTVVPGLTGLWQVASVARITLTGMVRLDALYVRQKSFWLDLKIMLKTVPALLLQIRDARDANQSSTRSGTSDRAAA
jgi:lipopolysaccharide/colanic/teichoic acid biosynthesis glycosyltransferase